MSDTKDCTIEYVSGAGRQAAAAKVLQAELALSGHTTSADQAPDVQGHQTVGQESENVENFRAGFQLNAQSTVCKYCLLELQYCKCKVDKNLYCTECHFSTVLCQCNKLCSTCQGIKLQY